jgi:hypothetical protein
VGDPTGASGDQESPVDDGDEFHDDSDGADSFVRANKTELI